VLALQLAHLTHRRAARAGLGLSVRALLAELACIGETILPRPAEGGRPRATVCSPTPPPSRTCSSRSSGSTARPQALTWVIHNQPHVPMLTSADTTKINLSRKVRLGLG